MPAGFLNGLKLAMAVFAVDQISKYWILYDVGLLSKGRIELLPFLNLTLVWNRGVSFGFLGDAQAEWTPYILIGLTSLVVAGLLVWLWRDGQGWLVVALGLVIGGAAGNIADRVVHGAVVDFFDVHFGGWHFWTFNVADSAISLGVAVLLVDSIWRKPPENEG